MLSILRPSVKFRLPFTADMELRKRLESCRNSREESGVQLFTKAILQFLPAMALDHVAGLGEFGDWFFFAASLDNVWAAGVEAAAGRGGSRARDFAFELLALAPVFRMKRWDRRKQSFGIGMLRLCE